MKKIIVTLLVILFALPSFAAKYFVDARGAYAAFEEAKQDNEELASLNSLDIVVKADLYNKETKQSKILFPGDYWEILDGKIIFVTKNSVFAEMPLEQTESERNISKTGMAKSQMTPREEVLFLFSYIETPVIDSAQSATFLSLVEESPSFRKMAQFFIGEIEANKLQCISNPNCCIATYGLDEMVGRFYKDTYTKNNTEKEKNSAHYATDYVSHIEQPAPAGKSNDQNTTNKLKMMKPDT